MYSGITFENGSNTLAMAIERRRYEAATRKQLFDLLDSVAVAFHILHSRRFCYCKQNDCAVCAECDMIARLINKIKEYKEVES